MMPIKVEIGQFREVNKGALVGFFTVVIQEHSQKICDCAYFNMNGRRWINFPQKEVKYTDGRKTSYFPIITFLDKDYDNAIREAILEALKDIKSEKNNGKITHQGHPRQANTLQGDASADWGNVPF